MSVAFLFIVVLIKRFCSFEVDAADKFVAGEDSCKDKKCINLGVVKRAQTVGNRAISRSVHGRAIGQSGS